MQLNNHILKLISNYLHLNENREERKELFSWYDEVSDHKTIGNEEINDAHARNRRRLFDAIKATSASSRKRKLFTYAHVAAAAAIVIFGVFSYIYYINTHGFLPLENSELNAVMPKPDSVLIRFSNGKDINPDTMTVGNIVAIGNDLSIHKIAAGKVQFITAGVEFDRTVTASLQTLKATHFTMILSDGTEVYMNANSRLTFPVAFTMGDRVVKLEGEAYFDVMKTTQHSKFFVRTNDQTIKVLGTKFNVSTAKDGLVTKTTLQEGSVSITPTNIKLKPILIKPDQEATLKRDGVRIAKVDASKVMSWKDGYFVFNGENTIETLEKIGSWYNLKVENQHHGPEAEFTGKIPTNVSLGELLNLLNYSGISVQAFKDQNGITKLIIL